MRKIIFFIVLFTIIPIASAFSGDGSGTQVDPYNITNCTQLQEMNEGLTSYYALINDLECNDTVNWNSGKGFFPIGNSSPYFGGGFDGNGYNITNLYVNHSTNYAGLFGRIIPGKNITDFGVINSSITGTAYTGGLVGFNDEANIINCFFIGNVTSTSGSYVGGLVGYSDIGMINNSYNQGNVTATSTYVGGVVGYPVARTILVDSHSNADVTGGGNYVGGFAGYIYSSSYSSTYWVDGCYATGNVYSTGSAIGGFAGQIQNINIKNSYATGNVTGGSETGGFFGWSRGTSDIVKYCYATGNVNSTSSHVGGFAGNTDYTKINNSYATGNVQSTSYRVGGFIGIASYGQIQNCFSKGNVTSTGADTVAGFISRGSAAAYNSYSTGYVSGVGSWLYGFIGDGQYPLTCYNSYWDNETSGQQSSRCNAVKKTTTQMKDNSTFTNVPSANAWDFAYNPYNDTGDLDYWHTDPTINDGYPFLIGVGMGLNTDISAPVINITSPINGTSYLNITDLNYTVTDLTGVDSCWWSNSSGANSSIVSGGTNWTDLTSVEGWNNWTVYCNDTIGHLGSALTTFNKDIYSPYFTAIANQTVEYKSTLGYQINATDDGTLSCFTVNDTTNFQINCSGYLRNNTELNVNLYWINITINDSVSNQNSSVIYINVSDTIVPSVSITYPTNNTNYILNVSSLNYTVTDNSNISGCWWSNNSGIWNSSIVTAGTNWTGLTSAEGWNNWTVWCNDTYNNLGNSMNQFFKDTILPVFGNVENQTITDSSGLAYQVNATDSNGISCFTVNDTDNFNINCSGWLTNNTFLAGGSYYLNITVNDTYNNVNNWLMLVETNDTAVPTFNNLTNQTLYEDVALAYQVNVTDSSGISCFTVNDTTNFKINCSGYLENKTDLDVALYWLNITVNDTYNNINSALMIVNSTARATIGLTLITPTTTQFNATQNQTFVVSVNVSCSNANCGEINVSLDPPESSEYYDDFESNFGHWATHSAINCVDSWFRGTSTSSSGTGPQSGGVGGAGTYFIYVETSSGNCYDSGDIALIYFNETLDYDSSQNEKIEFYFHAYGLTIDDLYLEENSTGTWVKLWEMHDINVNVWNFTQVNLTSLTGSGTLRFNYTRTSTDYTSDIALDRINITYSASEGKGGLISMNTSATPFYTTTQNPYNLTLNSGESQVVTWTVNATGTMWNNYTFFVYANQTSDMSISNITSTWNVTITNITGIQPPSISIVYPSNDATYGINVSDLNYTVSGNNLSACWYSTDSGQTNSTIVTAGTNWTGLTSTEGANTWTVYCNVTNNTIGSSSSTFTKDTSPPLISFVSPTLSNNSITLQISVISNVSIEGSDLGSVIYNWNGTNFTMYNDSLVLMFNFDNVSALGENDSSVFDLSGNGNNGTAGGTAKINATSKFGNALWLDGDSDYVEVIDSSSLDIGTNSMTITAWVYPKTFGDIDEIVKKDNSYLLRLSGTSGAVEGYLWADTDINRVGPSTNLLVQNSWNYVVMVYNTTTQQLFINGIADATDSQTGNVDNSAINLMIGSHQDKSSEFFEGGIDEVRIWNRALSFDEIYQQYISNLNKFNSTQWYLYVNQSKNATTELSAGNYTYQVFATDANNILNQTDLRTVEFQTNFAPTATMNSPSNNSHLNTETSVLLNATVYDNNTYLNNLTVWFYGGYANGTYTLLNASYNQTNGTNLVYNWPLGISGRYNWTVIVSDGIVNSSTIYLYFNLTNFSISCEAGGPYQQGALVLVQGAITNDTIPVQSYFVNVSIYDSNNVLNTTQNLTTSSDGSYETTVSELSVGSYILNTTSSYLGYNESCSDTFSVGGSASLILDKIVSVYNLTNSTVNYNVTLRVTNKGLGDANFALLTDPDSTDSPYDLSTVSANSSVVRGYILNLTRQNAVSYQLLSTAIVNGTDSYSGNEVSANSTEINLTIPDLGQQIIITKNIVYVSETSLNVTYNISSTLHNSGGENLVGVSYVDTDLAETVFTLNISTGNSSLLSNLVVVDKAASNTNRQFALGTATTSDSSVFYSNRPTVRIPGYGGPADAIVNAPASAVASTSFDTIITVENQNTDIGQDFTVDYWIANSDEATNYTSGQQTIYVAASGSSDLTATLTSPSLEGSYRFRALVTWAGGTATAYDSFVVSSSNVTEIPPSSSSSSSSGGGGSISGKAVDSIVCNSPYIRHGVECCLDRNNNFICDEDEWVVSETKKGIVEEIKKGGKVRVKIIGGSYIKNHSLEIIEIKGDRAIIKIYSPLDFKGNLSITAKATFEEDELVLTLYVGEERKLDLDGDGVSDLYVKLEGIENGKARVYLESIEGGIEVEEVGKNLTEEGKFSFDKKIGIYALAIFGIVILFIYLIRRIVLGKMRNSLIVTRENLGNRKTKSVRKMNNWLIVVGRKFSYFYGEIKSLFGKVDLSFGSKKMRFVNGNPCLSGLKGKEVYSLGGVRIGKIKEAVIVKDRVYGWIIELDKKYNVKKKILIRQKNVRAIKKVFIVDGGVVNGVRELGG